MDRQAYFRGVQRGLEWAQSWEEFLEVGKRNYLKYNVEYELPKSLHTFGNEYIQGRKDTVSQKLFPKDSFVKATPVKCFGDGNCLFRSVSLILQGDENLHLELRIRVVIEMAMNIDLYCSNEQMKTLNAKVQIPNPVGILWHTCIDKEHMKETVKESLKSQLMKWVKDGCFSSLWQIYAIANILLKPVATLYPQVFSVGLPRPLYHAILKPWGLQQEVPPLLIMWTHTENTSLWHWQPQSFRPLSATS